MPTILMRKLIVAVAALALTLNVALAQDSKMQKKADVIEAKAEVAGDKAALRLNKAERKAAKMSGDRDALKAARKERVKQEGELMKDRARKDVKVVKEKL